MPCPSRPRPWCATGLCGYRGAGVVILACGVSQKPGESRLALLERNAEVFRIVVGEVMAVCPGRGAAGRVQPRRHHGAGHAGHLRPAAGARDRVGHDPRHRAVPLAVGAAPRDLAQSVHAYVLGEHGDSEVLAWSNARAGSVPLTAFAAQIGSALTADVRARIDKGVRNAPTRSSRARARRGTGSAGARADRRRDRGRRAGGAVGLHGGAGGAGRVGCGAVPAPAGGGGEAFRPRSGPTSTPRRRRSCAPRRRS
jgi:L-lactate dehydrogenase